MACARPVIGADVGGITSTFADALTSYLVPPTDPGALAHKLALLHADRDLALEMGANGLGRAKRLFTWRRVSDALVDRRQKALSRRRGAPGRAPPAASR